MPVVGSDHDSQLLAAIVASSDDAIISKTADGTVTSWNAAAERMFGYTAQEMIGRPISLLAIAGREDEMPSILRRIRQGERVEHFETTRRNKNGSTVLVSITVSPIHDEAGRVIGASKVARDISAARRIAEELRQAQKRLQDQHRELLHAARLGELGQMAATMAHEINQPLSAITNYLHASLRVLSVEGEAGRAKLEQALRRATDQAVRASEVVRRLRSFAKPDDGRLRPESMVEILEETMALVSFEAAQHSVALALSSAHISDCILVDRIEIQQVLLNLIRNAVEAMDGKDRRELTVSTSQAEGVVEVAIADTGSGLAPSVRERLFQPFVTTKRNGMGIGLSVCRKIIDSHGGRLWAEDRSEGGTVFRFTIPTASAN